MWMRIIAVHRRLPVLQCCPLALKTRRTRRLSHPSQWQRGSQHKVHFGKDVELTRNLLIRLLHSELSQVRNDSLIAFSDTTIQGRAGKLTIHQILESTAHRVWGTL